MHFGVSDGTITGNFVFLNCGCATAIARTTPQAKRLQIRLLHTIARNARGAFVEPKMGQFDDIGPYEGAVPFFWETSNLVRKLATVRSAFRLLVRPLFLSVRPECVGHGGPGLYAQTQIVAVT